MGKRAKSGMHADLTDIHPHAFHITVVYPSIQTLRQQNTLKPTEKNAFSTNIPIL